jgi:hypothetical protein
VPNYMRLFATTNAGRTWEPARGLAALGNHSGLPRLACTGSTCVSLFGSTPQWKTFISLDAGLIWEPDGLASVLGQSHVSLLNPLSCNHGGLCTLVGNHLPNTGGFVLHSPDGGRSWLRGHASP